MNIRPLVYLLTFAVSIAALPAYAVSYSAAEKSLERYAGDGENREKLIEFADDLLLEAYAGIDDIDHIPPLPFAKQEKLLQGVELAIRIRQAVYGDDAVETGLAIYDASRIYHGYGWPMQTEQKLVSAYEVLSNQLGKDAEVLAWVYLDFAALRLNNGFSAAKPFYKNAIAVFQRRLGKSSPHTINAQVRYAASTLGHGRPEEARQLASQALDELLQQPMHSYLLEARLRGIIAGSFSAELHHERGKAAIVNMLDSLEKMDTVYQAVPCDEQPELMTLHPRPPKLVSCRDTKEKVRSRLIGLLMAFLIDQDRYKEADKLADKMTRPNKFADRMFDLQLRGKYKTAIRNIERLYPALGVMWGNDHPNWIDIEIMMGRLYEQAGDYEKSLNYLSSAATRLQNNAPNRVLDAAQVIEHVGVLYVMLDDVERARTAFELADSIFALLPKSSKFSGEPPLIDSLSISDRAYIELVLGDFQKAEAMYKQSLESSIERYGKRHIQTVNAMIQLGDFYSIVGHRTKAIEISRSAVELFEDSDMSSAANTYRLKGYLRALEQNFHEAVELHEQAVKLYKQDVPESNPVILVTQMNLVMAYVEAGQFEEALNLWDEVLSDERMVQLSEATGMQLRGEVFIGLGQYEEAVDVLEEAISHLLVSTNQAGLWDFYHQLSRALKLQGNTAGSVYYGKLAVNSLQNDRKNLSSLDKQTQQAFVDERADVYRHLADTLIEVGALQQAQEVLGLMKIMEYGEYTTRNTGRSDISVAISSQEIEIGAEADVTRQNLTTMRSEMRALKNIRDRKRTRDEERRLKRIQSDLKSHRRRFHRELSAIREEFATLGVNRVLELGEKNLESMGQLQSILRQQSEPAAFVHYLVLPDKVRMIVTTASNQYSFTTALSAKDLNQLIFEYREMLEDPGSEIEDVSQELYNQIFAPYRSVLEEEGVGRVLVSLDSTLRYVPISALHDGSGYVVENFEVAVFTPAAQLALGKSVAADPRVAGFGVSEHLGSFAPLPSVPVEMDRIVKEDDADLTGVLPGNIYMNNQFTQEKLQQVLGGGDDDYAILHIASHFAFIPGRESDSYLVLGGGEQLTIDDIRYGELDLAGIELLTLSACNTGIGGVGADGSEVEGFGALAQNQGVATVVASLWAVADESTADFMSRFYEKNATGMTKLGALASVQREFIEQGKQDFLDHPFFWAPFILMGNVN